MNSRITELVGDLAERDRRRENEQREQARKRMFDTAVSVPTIYELESELRRLERNFASIKTDFYLRIALFKRYLKVNFQEAKAREQVTVGSSEKQKIIMQISAVQTDIKRNMEERSE